MDLVAERDRLIAHHKAHETVPQSPWCPTNPSMVAEKAAAEAEKRPFHLLSERPIAFICDNKVKFVGDCVDKVLAGINSWNPPADYVDQYDNMYQRAVKAAKRIAVENKDAKQLVLFSVEWNQVNYILELQGIHVVSSQGE